MNPKTRHELWDGHAGPIEVSIDEPTAAIRGLAVIAHPHPLFGGTKDNKVVQTLARAFLQMGYTTLRFNFRGVGQSAGTHDNGQGETDDLAQLTEQARTTLLPVELQSQPVAMAGFSFGAFVTSHGAQRLREAGINIGKLVLVGTATSRFDVAPVPDNTLVIHGEVDDTVPLSDVLRWAGEQDLPVMVLPGVEHFFHGKLPQLKELVVRYYPS
ncbi:alpha/beta fold hydrolase [uncultured Limnobacter sp.]|uniref:alpha/beta hydrolase n=1 Tax=Limnobacter sp. TaxID=2003368 RepID=UPI0030F9CD2A